ncbi:hypothetical protein LCGC14_2112750 [marine sediment metagenome]|uniref:Uncharacterized protein n=1 Tax=marine sediment metagenome TaxID=412755 RepID=A0A0F9ETQ0_9ZZZZ
MSRPQQTIITYDAVGEVTTVEHRVVLTGTVNFGDGPKSVEEDRRDAVRGDQISSATVVAAKDLLDAFEVDLAAERQRVATAAQAEADRVAALALQAQADADKRQSDADE